MLITEKVKVKINNRYVKYYKEKGYDVKGGDEIEIPVCDLPEQSHIKVDVRCDNCKEEKSIMFYNYINNVKKQDTYLCKKCKHIKTEKTNMKKYGVRSTLQTENVIKKTKQHNLEKYGVEHYSQTEEFKNKLIEKNLEKYGTEWFFQSDEYKSIKKNLFIEKYGVEFYSQTEDFNEKVKSTSLERYGVEHYSKTSNFKETIKNNTIEKYFNKNINILDIFENDILIKCEKNHIYKIDKNLLKNRLRFNVEPCLECNPINSSVSDKEIKLYEFIKENYDGKIITSDRTVLNGKELDIYLPDLKLAFEFNGVYWHNELNKENDYHLNKTEDCLNNNIQLFHVWEDDWVYKQEIIKSMILNKLNKTKNKIYARKTEIREIENNSMIRTFLDENHLQGFVGSKIKLGLFYKNELVSLMTFGKKRIISNTPSLNDEYELLRFCNKINTNVVGSASKLFNYFTKKYKPNEIISYADRSHSQGNLYKTLGFNFNKKTQPNYYYIINGIRYHRFNFRKDVLIKQGFDKNKTEHEIMFERKIYRVYDSGSLKYIY